MTAIWIAWGVVIVVSFAVFERYALKHGKTTLSRAIWNANRAWPLTSYVAGALCGGLAVHFFWNWNPLCN